MICGQCGTENANARLVCSKCGRPLRSDVVKGVVTCKNHGNRPATTICDQCLKPICDECTVVRGTQTFCVEDSSVDSAEKEDDLVDHLSVGDPATVLHAGFASRLVSLIIDLAFCLLLSVLLGAVFWLVTGSPFTGLAEIRTAPFEFLLYWLLLFVFAFSYFVFLISAEGQTFGHQAMRIAVVEIDGATPSVGTATSRFFFSILSLLCLGLGFIAIINDPEKRGWHDRWANTYVISLDEATERL